MYVCRQAGPVIGNVGVLLGDVLHSNTNDICGWNHGRLGAILDIGGLLAASVPFLGLLGMAGGRVKAFILNSVLLFITLGGE